MDTFRQQNTPPVLDLARMSSRARRQRADELRVSRHRALRSWLDELAHLELAGFRSNVTKELERKDLASLRAGDPSRFRGIYPHETTPWAFVLTAHYLRAQDHAAQAAPIAALVDVERHSEPIVRCWLSSAERQVADLAKTPDEILFELWLAQSIYCAAQRERLDSLVPDLAQSEDGFGSSDVAVLKNAAEAGDRRAAYAWALAELNGIGTPARPDAGVRWMTRAASLGHPEAQYELGTMYTNGWSVARDEIVGLAWFLAAQRTGHDHAERQVETLGSRLPAEHVARARSLSATLMRSAPRSPGA